MKIIIIRHGETYANTLYNTEKQILIGALNSEITYLTEKGKEQAVICKEKLMNDIIYDRIDYVYSSDLERTIQTSNLIFYDHDIIYDNRLRERSLGDAEGIEVANIDNYPSIKQKLVNEDDSLDVKISKKQLNGESYIDVYRRAKDFMSQFNKEDDLTIAIVTHFHFIKCLLYAMNDEKFDEHLSEIVIENASPLYYEFKNNRFITCNYFTNAEVI